MGLRRLSRAGVLRRLAKESPTVMAGLGFFVERALHALSSCCLIVAGMSLYIWRTCRRLDRGAALRVSDG